MSGTSDQISRTTRYARRFAASLAKNKLPEATADLEDYLEQFPEDVLIALQGFVEHAADDGADDPLTLGHLFLVQCQLERIRYRKDRGCEDALGLIDAFQHEVAGLAGTGRIDGPVLSMVTAALHQVGIAASAELGAAVTRCAEDLLPDMDIAPPDLTLMLEAVAKQCGNDPFLVASLLAETGHAVLAQARAAMAVEQIRSANAVAREAAVLLVLDPEPAVRQTAAVELQALIGSLSPASLRRLIAMRNWCLETEQHLVDAVVRTARTKGIACAPWQEGRTEVILASCIDGSGAQGFLIVSPDGKRKQLSSVLLKNGIRDAWATPPTSRRDVQSTLDQAAREATMLPVSRDYFDRAIRHHLQLGLAAGTLPPAGLLQVAEIIGGAHWQPEALEWRQGLATMVAELPAAMLEPNKVRALLRASDAWAGFDSISESWFEDDQDVARVIGSIRSRERAKTVEYVLQNVLARRREKWAEHFMWTALWLREVLDGEALPWRSFVVLAHALANGHDLSDMSLMREIAARTVVAFASRPAQAPRRNSEGQPDAARAPRSASESLESPKPYRAHRKTR